MALLTRADIGKTSALPKAAEQSMTGNKRGSTYFRDVIKLFFMAYV